MEKFCGLILHTNVVILYISKIKTDIQLYNYSKKHCHEKIINTMCSMTCPRLELLKLK